MAHGEGNSMRQGRNGGWIQIGQACDPGAEFKFLSSGSGKPLKGIEQRSDTT